MREVQPTRSTGPTRGASIFVAFIANRLSEFIVQFCRERATSHAGAVGLENPQYLTNAVGR